MVQNFSLFNILKTVEYEYEIPCIKKTNLNLWRVFKNVIQHTVYHYYRKHLQYKKVGGSCCTEFRSTKVFSDPYTRWVIILLQVKSNLVAEPLLGERYLFNSTIGALFIGLSSVKIDEESIWSTILKKM